MEQYTPYANNSEHPSTLTVYTKLLLESLTFLLTTLVILSEKVDPNKVPCYDMISIVLLQLCSHFIGDHFKKLS